MSKARLIYFVLVASVFAYGFLSLVPKTHGFNNGGGFV